jgi:four helix bundle protein
MNKPHKKLNLWSDAVDLAQQIYKVTERFPSNEQFGLTSQVRRAAVSIPSNLAEGAARQTKKEFLNFLHIAKGSLSELDTQLEIARRLEYLDQARREALDERLEQIDRMLSDLVRSLRRRNNP